MRSTARWPSRPRADVAVVVVGGETADTEGHDRPDMDLPAEQVALVRAVAAVNPKTVVVVNTGSPVTMDWVDEVGGVAQVWYPGPGGRQRDRRRAVRRRRRLRQAAARRSRSGWRTTRPSPTTPATNGRARYGEGIFVGYRHYDANEVEPLFPFGHGLSYTRFAYGDLRLDVVDPSDPAAAGASGPQALVTATVDVTNVGDRPGREVVQLYVRDVDATVAPTGAGAQAVRQGRPRPRRDPDGPPRAGRPGLLVLGRGPPRLGPRTRGVRGPSGLILTQHPHDGHHPPALTG